jgi:hypothetical protein
MVTEKSGHALSEIAVRREPAKLEINVIYTDCDATLAAIRYAARMATSLHARIPIVLPAIVPYPLTLDECPLCEAHRRRLFEYSRGWNPHRDSRGDRSLSQYADLNRTMPPHSIVIVGGRRRWWPWSVGSRLDRPLSAGGHNVIRGADKKDSHA